MKNILFLHPTLLFYKIPIYNKLSAFLEKRGYRLIVWYTDIKPENELVMFENLGSLPFSFTTYNQVLNDYKIDFVINLMFRTKPSIYFYLYSVISARLKGKKVFFYGHGINLNQKHNKFSIFIYNLIHLLFQKIILYSPNEKKYLWNINMKKVSVAYNTLDLDERNKLVTDKSKEEIRGQLNIKEKFVILFSGRIEKRKNLDFLLDYFIKNEYKLNNIALIIVGPGMNKADADRIEKCKNVYSFGPIYDRIKMAEIFKASDVFCIPGHIGLGLIEAMYWGLPVFTFDVVHAPEIFYLENGVNGYLLRDSNQFDQELFKLIENPELLLQLSENAKKTYSKKANLENMFNGFLQALEK